MRDKVVGSAAEVDADIAPGARIAVGGFRLAGIPWILIDALALRFHTRTELGVSK